MGAGRGGGGELEGNIGSDGDRGKEEIEGDMVVA